MSAIRTENLFKHFRHVRALSGLNLGVPEGAAYALVGPNGSGKTTAIKLLMNILQPTSGSAEVLGMPSSELRGRAFTSIGYVSENQELPLWMRGGVFFQYVRAFYNSWDVALEQEIVNQFALPLDRKLRHLSRGTRMKAALASALAYRPQLVVLDEPFGGLDPLVRDELIAGMRQWAAGATIFVSSHDLEEIESFVTHVGYLEAGRLQFSEAISTLTARFRQVEVMVDFPPAPPSHFPPTWMQVQVSNRVVRFVEVQFDQERLTSEIHQVFGTPQKTTLSAMSLRSIFLVMARAGRARGENV
jgi:ABC-2 type transport system ATP-binding protein